MTAFIKEDKEPSEDRIHKILTLARLLGEFCTEHTASSLKEMENPFVDEAGPVEADAEIDRHIKELRYKNETMLPEGKAALLRLYDRLQQRKSRRLQSEFYLTAREGKLADLVLRYLDEEIEAAEGQS
ncbi:MAG: hypothetical protein KGI37_10465 [Alphaproteobacteria bacterium]|nr:hypothetical protein [Alphaproteobacteria bacterium]